MKFQRIPPKAIRMLPEGEYPRQHYNDDHSPKRGFTTYEKADANARSYNLNHDQKMNVYRCKYCGKFHIGHKEKENENDRQRN